jgi:hypothetical protein
MPQDARLWWVYASCGDFTSDALPLLVVDDPLVWEVSTAAQYKREGSYSRMVKIACPPQYKRSRRRATCVRALDIIQCVYCQLPCHTCSSHKHTAGVCITMGCLCACMLQELKHLQQADIEDRSLDLAHAAIVLQVFRSGPLCTVGDQLTPQDVEWMSWAVLSLAQAQSPPEAVLQAAGAMYQPQQVQHMHRQTGKVRSPEPWELFSATGQTPLTRRPEPHSSSSSCSSPLSQQ